MSAWRARVVARVVERWCHADVNAEIVAMELVWIGARERAGHSLQQVCHTATKVAAKAACRQREWLMRPRPPILMGSVAAALARTARSCGLSEKEAMVDSACRMAVSA